MLVSLEKTSNVISSWDSYYQSYLMVVHNESITVPGYVLNSFSLMSSFIGPFVGV